jgi:SHS2 domain-containing protein
MPYTYLEHLADVGIMSTGATLEEVFESGAEAMLNVMFDLDTIEYKSETPITCEAENIEMLFIEVLNEMLSRQDIEGIAIKGLKRGKVEERDGIYHFRGAAGGEPFNAEKHSVKTEVKAATYAGLEYRVEKGQHILRCILDV